MVPIGPKTLHVESEGNATHPYMFSNIFQEHSCWVTVLCYSQVNRTRDSNLESDIISGTGQEC